VKVDLIYQVFRSETNPCNMKYLYDLLGDDKLYSWNQEIVNPSLSPMLANDSIVPDEKYENKRLIFSKENLTRNYQRTVLKMRSGRMPYIESQCVVSDTFSFRLEKCIHLTTCMWID
jgi:hypothetical protein